MFAILSLVALAISFVPHLYTTAVTAAYLLLAALFYPSVRVMTEFQDIGIISEWMKFPGLLAESYYDCRKMRIAATLIYPHNSNNLKMK